MTDRLHLLPRHRKTLESFFEKFLPGVEIWAYDSRIDGRSHEGSDLNLVLRGQRLKEIPSEQLAEFWGAVSESSIPFLVEARDWARLPERFHRVIEQRHVEMKSRDGKGNAGR